MKTTPTAQDELLAQWSLSRACRARLSPERFLAPTLWRSIWRPPSRTPLRPQERQWENRTDASPTFPSWEEVTALCTLSFAPHTGWETQTAMVNKVFCPARQ